MREKSVAWRAWSVLLFAVTTALAVACSGTDGGTTSDGGTIDASTG